MLSHVRLFHDTMGCSPPGTFCPWDFSGQNTGVGCHFLLQGIFPTQGSNLHLLHWQVYSLPLHHLRTALYKYLLFHFIIKHCQSPECQLSKTWNSKYTETDPSLWCYFDPHASPQGRHTCIRFTHSNNKRPAKFTSRALVSCVSFSTPLTHFQPTPFLHLPCSPFKTSRKGCEVSLRAQVWSEASGHFSQHQGLFGYKQQQLGWLTDKLHLCQTEGSLKLCGPKRSLKSHTWPQTGAGALLKDMETETTDRRSSLARENKEHTRRLLHPTIPPLTDAWQAGQTVCPSHGWTGAEGISGASLTTTIPPRQQPDGEE